MTGRVLLILGAINGGFGLQLAEAGRRSEIVYGVLAGLVFLTYVAMVIYSMMTTEETYLGKKSSTSHTDTSMAEANGRTGRGNVGGI